MGRPRSAPSLPRESAWPATAWSPALGVVVALAACGGSDPADEGPEPGAELLGGATTIFDATRNAYTFAARNLDDAGRSAFSLGDHFFNRNWVTAPASTSANDGLGPMFNATSCSACHFKDGRGAPPETADENPVALLMRLSVAGQDAHGGPRHEPNYGEQFNHRAILGVPPEGTVRVTYEEVAGAYADGEPFSLRRPSYTFPELGYGPFAPDVMISPRIAPANFGLGLLEAIDEATVLALADEDDRDGDGISGRPNRVWNTRAGRATLGRFGWKANQPTVEQQTAAAFLGDIGITTSLFNVDNCTAIQLDCLEAPPGGTPEEPELSEQKLGWVTDYGMTIAVPARRGWTDPTVVRGEKLFREARCSGCHVMKITTGELPRYPALSRQVIRPFTDLLLHDMGDGLADGRPDFEADGREWRTAPLWGIGLVRVVNRHQFFLHDGRARGFAEAILWHGGEAEASREAFRAMPKADRDALLAFLDSL